ncbi:MAG TPA: TIGR02266 family protein [Polyangiaceae bacterium]|nr:TIGR02266 family protein [Polyangiaceae bacterium]
MATPPPAPRDQRAYPRLPFEIDITLESESQFYTGFSENLSEGGIFVATHALRPVGSRLDMVFTLPGVKGPMRAEGAVCWLRLHSDTSDLPAGMGLRFVSLRSEDAEIIRAFCAHRPPLFFDL